MRGFAVVLLEELSRRRQLMMAAAAAALLPLVLPYLMRLDHPVAEVREVLAWIIGLLCGGLYALFLGASFIGSDLATGRLGFSFARPVSATSIWFGKLTAVCLLSTGSLLLILVPAALLHWSSFTEDLDGFVFLAVVLAAPLAIVLVSHAVGVMARARSPWLLLDIAALVVTVVVFWEAVRPLLAAGALVATWHGVATLGTTVLVALSAAGACQMVHGRADLRRAHRALSIPLWSLVLASAAGLLGYSTWLRSPAPEDLVTCETVLSQRDGGWSFVSGHARGRSDYMAAMLVNTDGRWLNLGHPTDRYLPWFAFSTDGDAAVLARSRNAGGTDADLFTVALDHPQPRLEPTGQSIGGMGGWLGRPLHYSSATGRLASFAGSLFVVQDLARGRIVLSMRVEGLPVHLVPQGPDLVRLYLATDDGETGVWRHIRVVEVDTRNRSQREVGRTQGEPRIRLRSFNLDRRGERMLVETSRMVDRDHSLRRVELLDAVTGEPVPSFDPAALEGAGNACFLADDRIVAEVGDQATLSLRVLDPAGNLVRHIGLGAGQRVRFGGQPSADRLVLVIFDESDSTDPGWRTVEVDLAEGSVHPIGEKLLPVLLRPRHFFHQNFQPQPPGGAATRLFTRNRKQLLLLDETTGELRPIAGAREP